MRGADLHGLSSEYRHYYIDHCIDHFTYKNILYHLPTFFKRCKFSRPQQCYSDAPSEILFADLCGA